MMYSGFLAVNLAFDILTIVLNYCFSTPQEANIFVTTPVQIMWAAALTSYMYKSASVKRTFANTYEDQIGVHGRQESEMIENAE